VCSGGTLSQTGACAPICTTVQRGTFGNVQDAHIASDHPSANFGASQSLTAGSVPPGYRQALVQWDLGFVPSDAKVTSATITLHVLLYGGEALSVHRALAPWTESTVTFASFGGAFSAQVEATLPGTPVTSTAITALAQGWVSGAVPNDGILIDRALDGSTVFDSSEVPTVSARPRLDVCYVPCH
jgi:hypothetical protein